MYRYILIISTGIFLLNSGINVAAEENQKQEILWNDDCASLKPEIQKGFLPNKIQGSLKHPFKLLAKRIQGLAVSRVLDISTVTLNDDPNCNPEKEIELMVDAISLTLKDPFLPDPNAIKSNIIIMSVEKGFVFDVKDFLAVKFQKGEYVFKVLKSTGYNVKFNTFLFVAVERIDGKEFEALKLPRSILKDGLLPLAEFYPNRNDFVSNYIVKKQGNFKIINWLASENLVSTESGHFFAVSDFTGLTYGNVGSCLIHDVFYMTNKQTAFLKLNPTPIPRSTKKIRGGNGVIYSLPSSHTNK